MDKSAKWIKAACFAWMALEALALFAACVAESAGWHAPAVETWTAIALSAVSATAALLPAVVEDNRLMAGEYDTFPGAAAADRVAEAGLLAMMTVILCWVNSSQGTLAWLAVTGGAFAGALLFYAIVRHENNVLDEMI